MYTEQARVHGAAPRAAMQNGTYPALRARRRWLGLAAQPGHVVEREAPAAQQGAHGLSLITISEPTRPY